MEKTTLDIQPNGHTKITYHDGHIKALNPEQWASLQRLRLECRAKYGAAVESVWYSEQLEELRSGR